ncbi:MAG TPA: putative sugar nucleotidyl transferase [Planctomycetaceae bacterium]|nr:putative sugar nucleotidyl transferase [Planctomycetaceae bacterium]
MRVALFEDDLAANFLPLVWLRPVCELLCGHFSARERAIRFLPVTEWGVFCRPELSEVYAEDHPEAQINVPRWLSQGRTLLLSSRWLVDPHELAKCDPDAAGLIDGEVAWISVEPEEMPLFLMQDCASAVNQLARTRRRVKTTGQLVKYPWDLIAHNADQLALDFRARPKHSPQDLSGTQAAVVGSRDDVYVDATASIDPFVVIDARKGPVYIDAGAMVQAFTRLEGPCYIGRESQLFRTNLREGTSIGPVCRVGGEIEGAILHGYVNKYHDGFLGHGYVGPWCNLGALTTNSDLKNDYSTVKVPLIGEAIETGQKKVGVFIGDHTKTAIGSCFNTGTSVGIMCQVLPGGELLPKHIPSFSRIWHGELADGFPLDNGLATARAAMDRRARTLTDAQEQLLRHVFHATTSERDSAFQRHAERRAISSAR